MKPAEFEQMKEKWLRDHFAQAAITKPAESGVIATVPRLYRVEFYEPRTRSEFTRRHTGRDRFIITPVEVRGRDPKDGISALFDEIVMNPRTWMGGIEEYRPKNGQNPDDVIKIGEPMVVVRHDDPEHRHGSPRLVDFLVHEIFPVPGGIIFEKGSLRGMHSHFLID